MSMDPHTAVLVCLGGALLLWMPVVSTRGARMIALTVSIASLLCGLMGFRRLAGALAAGEPMYTSVDAAWIDLLGIRYTLGYDGISLTLVALTGIASVAGVLFSWNVKHQVKAFFSLYLLLITGVYGVFLSFDLFLLFVFYELAIIPKYFLIARWGSGQRRYAAMKLALYSFVGSAMVLVVILAVVGITGGTTMNLLELARMDYSETFQAWAFPLMFFGFAILAGIWPFHSWAPTGHSSAPTAASMLLAGVVMKLGAYGALRVAMTFFPEGLEQWRPLIATLGLIGILYGAGAAFVQRDFKYVIGYSSVSHMGFVVLGLATVSLVGLTGAVLQMFSHGIIAGLLFGVVGRMIYDRAHTRELSVLEGMALARRWPFAMVVFVVAGFASMGMPGFSGFVAELQILLGAWSTAGWMACVGGIGIVLGAVYTLKVLNQVFFSSVPATREVTDAEVSSEPISWPEKSGAILLMIASLVVGVYPRILLDWIVPALEAPLFSRIWEGGGL